MTGLRAEARTAFLDVALAVAPGETVAVVGPNGAGKSTLVRALAGLLRYDGAVTLDGAPVTPPVGVVFQDGLLFPHLTALDNVAFGLRGPQRRRVAAGWLDRLGAGGCARLRPGALSGGQARRVALARALAPEPRLLLLDEPLTGLDAGARVEVRHVLRDVLAAYEGVRLLVTHDPVEARALASRLVVLEAGRVVQDGPTEEVAARPRSAYVAALVGTNLLRGKASGGSVDVGGAVLVPASAPPPGDVLTVVPPRAVALYAARPDGSPRNVWPATVASVDPLGDRVRVRLSGPLPLVAEVTPAAVAALGLAPGSAVWAAVKATEVEVFPA